MGTTPKIGHSNPGNLAREALWETRFEGREDIWPRDTTAEQAEDIPGISLNTDKQVKFLGTGNHFIPKKKKSSQVPANKWTVNNAVQNKKVLEQWKILDNHQIHSTIPNTECLRVLILPYINTLLILPYINLKHQLNDSEIMHTPLQATQIFKKPETN